MTEVPLTGDSWKTPELRAAEAHLAEVEIQADEVIERAKAMPVPPTGDPASRERLDAIKNAAGAPDAPAELRLLKRNVDEGRFSWEDVLAGKQYQDEEVRNAMASKLADMRSMYQEFEEGYTLDEVIEARGGYPPAAPSAGSSPHASPEEPHDDDYFDGGSFLR